MNIDPIYDRVIVQRVVVEEKSEGGIIIPGTAQDKSLEGIVVAHGEGSIDKETGEIDVPITVKVGDRIIFPKHCGTDIRVHGEDYLVMVEADILAILDPEDE